MKHQSLSKLPKWFLERKDSVNILYGMIHEAEGIDDIEGILDSPFVFQTSDSIGIYVGGVSTEEESIQFLEDADSRGHHIDWVCDTAQGYYRNVVARLVLAGDQ